MSQSLLSRISWPNSTFLISTLVAALVGVPIYLWHYGIDLFQICLFVFFYYATGMSITLGYHRLFSHKSFKASWPVRLVTLLFGAAAFESSLLIWASDHRNHHKHVDHDEDPYNINKGFFHAHIGWLLYDVTPMPLDNVKDLKADKLVMWQHNNYLLIAFFMCFGLPALVGWMWGGASAAFGAFMLAGLARVVVVQHFTFFINSFCHMIGRQPYTNQNTARDSAIMALFTYGEGYHNYHHQFQHDYRNGVKPWQFDPTKWCIWLLSKFGMTSDLRRVPDEKILMAEITEQQRRLAMKLDKKSIHLPESVTQLLHTAQEQLHESFSHWEVRKAEYVKVVENRMDASRKRMKEVREEARQATDRFLDAIDEWKNAHQLVLAQLA